MHIKTNHILASLVAGLSLGTLSGCATVVSGSDQSLTIETKPAGAVCTLTRDGSKIAVVNPTPGTVQIDKDKDDIQITCIKDGYWETTGSLGSDFQGMTFGNIILGGLIGVVVDGASGAMHEYPTSFSLNMVPTQFADEAARTAFFDNWRKDVESEAKAAMEAAEKVCSDSECDQKREKISALKDKKLEEIKEQEARSKIG